MVYISYSNSILATIISYIGAAVLGVAIMVAVAMSDFISVLPAMAIGAGLMLLAKLISVLKDKLKKR